MATTSIFMNDFVGLPIIISDYDALTSNSNTSEGANRALQPTTQQPTTQQTSRQQSTSSSEGYILALSATSAQQQNWQTGFSDFADQLWAKVTQGMKQKLRDACIEVLKKTEDPEPEGMSWQYDDDARFLD